MNNKKFMVKIVKQYLSKTILTHVSRLPFTSQVPRLLWRIAIKVDRNRKCEIKNKVYTQ